MTARVLAVTVLFNSEQALSKWYCLTPSEDVRVVVVDNASSDGGSALARQRGLEVLVSAENLGFGRGCNLGAARAGTEEWIAFVNPDVSITAEQLVKAVNRVPDGVVATSPLLCDADGVVLADVVRSRPTTRFVVAVWLLGRRGVRSGVADVSASPDGSRVPTEVTSGACLLVRREAFESVGGFPQWLFFNLEDIVLCEELGRFGGIDVDLGLRVAHQKLSSADATPIGGLLAETARATSAYFAARRSGVSWVAVLLSVLVGYGMRSVVRGGEGPGLVAVAGVCVREGVALRRSRPTLAGPRFVGQR